jgi:hypothetical protein
VRPPASGDGVHWASRRSSSGRWSEGPLPASAFGVTSSSGVGEQRARFAVGPADLPLFDTSFDSAFSCSHSALPSRLASRWSVARVVGVTRRRPRRTSRWRQVQLTASIAAPAPSRHRPDFGADASRRRWVVHSDSCGRADIPLGFDAGKIIPCVSIRSKLVRRGPTNSSARTQQRGLWSDASGPGCLARRERHKCRRGRSTSKAGLAPQTHNRRHRS